jgi:dihydrolipoamide dehydrogenase
MKTYDLIIIGGGPAGYVAGIRAAQLGLTAAVFERRQLGGTCLNVGCIPTKTLFQSAEVADTVKESKHFGIDSTLDAVDFSAIMERKDAVVKQLVSGVEHLLKKHKVDVIRGNAKLVSAKKVMDTHTQTVYDTKNILIATGSENAVPPIPGLTGKNVLGSTELLALKAQPKSIAVIGGGVIGCEFASILSSLGSKVSVIEMLPQLLGTTMDIALARETERLFAKKGIVCKLSSKVKSVEDRDGVKAVTFETGGKEETVMAEYVLVSAGRKPNTEGLGCETVGLKMNRGFIETNDKMETSVPGIYAAGDVTGKVQLAHVAYEAATVAVENIAGKNRRMDSRAIPKVVFVENEISSVGMTEQEAKAAGYDVLVGNFNLAGNGKALAMGKNKGFVKVVSEKENHAILGVHMAGPCASELVTVGTTMVACELLLEDVAETRYPHPAVSEAIREACLDALGRAVHA